MKPITETEERIIEMTRKLTRSLITQVADRGVLPVDATIGLAYALHDAATELTGDPIQAIEWMRNATDTMEAQLMGGVDAARAH
jgi:phage gp45-like